IQIDPETYEVGFKVIGNDKWNLECPNPKAMGICGSGMIDGIAELYRAGLIDKGGRQILSGGDGPFRRRGGHI
ncbi:MAG: DUF4445 domain-containing protein, partial [Deltaproteobacteria bacterium]|nr:DUF4445 domain-containing protein [Deltaproteobacteria bacterium]